MVTWASPKHLKPHSTKIIGLPRAPQKRSFLPPPNTILSALCLFLGGSSGVTAPESEMPAAMSWLGAPIDPADAAARWPHRTESAEAPKHYERCRLSGQEIKLGDAVAVRCGEWDSKADTAKHQTTQQKLAKGNTTKGSSICPFSATWCLPTIDPSGVNRLVFWSS